MDNLRFVLESPQVAQTQKKRPRLVTSCDNCRLKKIKCVPTTVQGKCEACEAGGVSCEFRDRERYFAERSRSVTAAAAASSGSTSSLSTQRRGSRSPANVSQRSTYGRRSPRSVADASAPSVWYPSTSDHQQGAFASSTSYPSIAPSSSPPSGDWFLGDEGISGSSSGYFGQSAYPGTSYPATGSPSGLSDTYSTYSSSPLNPPMSGAGLAMLFDPRRPQHPDPALMPHFLDVFRTYYGPTFPFLSHEEMINRVRQGASYGLLECAVAALAARYSNSSTVLACGVSAAIEAYASKARAQLQESSLLPSVYVLHATILLAWVEYKAGNMAGLQEYTTASLAVSSALQQSLTSVQMANRTAQSHGLGRDSFFPGASEQERIMYRDTWSSIMTLQQLSGSSISRPSSGMVAPLSYMESSTGRSSLSHMLYNDPSRHPSDEDKRMTNAFSGPPLLATCSQASLTSYLFHDLASPLNMTALSTTHDALYI
ncbi:unnamed protein product [Peniophora sp. CBMAI 1063]|nr:unnamed protein product [Peniophora sp. CBMAI 1063]